MLGLPAPGFRPDNFEEINRLMTELENLPAPLPGQSQDNTRRRLLEDRIALLQRQSRGGGSPPASLATLQAKVSAISPWSEQQATRRQ